jgi:hypothetical protein
MRYKIVVAVIGVVVVTTIIVTMYVINKNKRIIELPQPPPPNEKNEKHKKYKSNMKHYQTMTKDEFDMIKPAADKVLYYFPGKCPEFTEDMFLKTKNIYGLDQYFMPEKGSLIQIDINHSWTNEPTFEHWVNKH